MKALLFILLLAIVGCTKSQWKKLGTFEDSFRKVKLSAEEAIASVEEMMLNRTDDSLDFIGMMEKTKVALWSFNESTECSETFDIVKRKFRNAFNRLEAPIMKRITEIRQRLIGVSSTIVYYQKSADTKYWSCRLSDNEGCDTAVEQWLNRKLLSLSCEIISCEAHVLKKRHYHYNRDCSGMFQCSSTSKCIDKRFVCDGEDHCPDRSDEQDCPLRFNYTLNNCKAELGKYLCLNMNCITISARCDGKDDCGDGSDEYDCPKKEYYGPNNCSLELGTYLCGNKKCIGLSLVCDGSDDCQDGTDEGTNCTTSCKEDCHPEGVCLRSPQGALCVTSCPEGFVETSSGCERNMEPEKSPVSHLVLDMERLISRHLASYLRLKTRAISDINKLSFIHDCWKHNSKIDMITKIGDKHYNKTKLNSTESE